MSSSLPYVIFGNTSSLNLLVEVEDEVVEEPGELELVIRLKETIERWSLPLQGSPTHDRDFWLQDRWSLRLGLHEFLIADRPRRFVHYMLSSMRIDSQLRVDFEERILEFVRVYAASASAMKFKKLVVVGLVAEIEINKKMMMMMYNERGSAEEYRQARFGMVAASRSAIESLKTRVYEGKEDNEQCMVCLDEFALGEKLLSMPCSHLFHEECIVSWLEESNVCPICRFKI